MHQLQKPSLEMESALAAVSADKQESAHYIQHTRTLKIILCMNFPV